MFHLRQHITGTSFECEFVQSCGNKLTIDDGRLLAIPTTRHVQPNPGRGRRVFGEFGDYG